MNPVGSKKKGTIELQVRLVSHSFQLANLQLQFTLINPPPVPCSDQLSQSSQLNASKPSVYWPTYIEIVW